MRGLVWFIAVAGALSLTFFQGFGVGASLEAGQAYRVAFPLNSVSLTALQMQAQMLGWSVRVQNDAEVNYYLGLERCLACETAMESLFFDLPQLVVDGNLFMLRLDTDAFRLNLRPQVDAAPSYELVLVMKQTLEAESVVNQINQELSQFGMMLASDVEFEAIPLSSKARGPVPSDVRMEEPLFRLTQAPDWPDFASLQGLDLSGLRVRVIVDLVDGQVLPTGLGLVEESRAGSRVRVQVLITDLLNLGRDPAVAEVSVPLQAQPGS